MAGDCYYSNLREVDVLGAEWRNGPGEVGDVSDGPLPSAMAERIQRLLASSEVPKAELARVIELASDVDVPGGDAATVSDDARGTVVGEEYVCPTISSRPGRQDNYLGFAAVLLVRIV